MILVCISFFPEKWKKRALRRASFARPSYRSLLRSNILSGRRVNGPAGRARSLRESVPLHAVFPPVNLPVRANFNFANIHDRVHSGRTGAV